MVERVSQPQQRPAVSAGMWVRALLLIAVLPAGVLFGAAGTLRWQMAWLLLGLTVISFALSRYIVWRIHPDLLAERGKMMDHGDTAGFDQVLAPLLALVGPLLIELVAGLGVRFGWQPVFPAWAKWLGVGLYLLGMVIGTWALAANRYFSGVVRIQTERDHNVVTGGPYAFVRHPGYLGAVISYAGMVLMLGTVWALIPYAAQQAVLVVRTVLEDRMLHEELPGYREYAQQTRYRLIPGLW